MLDQGLNYENNSMTLTSFKNILITNSVFKKKKNSSPFTDFWYVHKSQRERHISQVKKKILSRVCNIASSLRHKSFCSTPASPKREYMTQDCRKQISNLAVKILHHIQSGHVCEKQLKEISKYKEFNAVFSLLVRFKYNKQENEIERKIDKEKIMFELRKLIQSSHQRRTLLNTTNSFLHRSVIERPKYIKF